MKGRFQFGFVLSAWLAAGLFCGTASAQRSNAAAQQEGKPEQSAPRMRLRPKLPNAIPPAPNANKLPPKAIERLQDMPPQRQEQFFRNNQRFQNLPPEQQARSLESPDAGSATGFARKTKHLGADDSRAAEKRAPVPAPALAAITSCAATSAFAAPALAAQHERSRTPDQAQRSCIRRGIKSG